MNLEVNFQGALTRHFFFFQELDNEQLKITDTSLLKKNKL